MEILRIEDLSFRYPKSEKPALDHVNLNIDRGDFTVLCGRSGCGKTTLLRLLKNEIAPFGEKSGRIVFGDLGNGGAVTAADIGFVGQDPESQIVTDKVWHELAFGLENMGLPSDVIRRRVGETASFFGIQDWFRKRTDELSGGQKQLLNLASVMAMQPKLLLLDEPTGQLDPIAASDFIAVLKKLNRDLGLTVIVSEQRLEEVFPIADRIVMLDSGAVVMCDAPREACRTFYSRSPDGSMEYAFPSAVRIWHGVGSDGVCPLTVKEGREFLETHFDACSATIPAPEYKHGEKAAVELKNVWFRYGKDLPDVMRGTTFEVYESEIFAILGGNGAGKTTALNVIAGLDKAYRGKITVNGKRLESFKGNELYRHGIALLPQDPKTVFVKDTVRGDLSETVGVTDKGTGASDVIADIAEKLGISHLLDRHPYDLSGGEQQKCALAKVLLSEPKILLLDEPTKCIDGWAKKALRDIFQKLREDGITVIFVTHDVEFAAETADRCALFFDGEIISSGAPRDFFSENNFYTTSANRMARGLWKNAVTCEDVIECCRNAGDVS